MKKSNISIWIRKGTEVHGPDGWVRVLEDCTVNANLDISGYEWHYLVGGADFWVTAADGIIL